MNLEANAGGKLFYEKLLKQFSEEFIEETPGAILGRTPGGKRGAISRETLEEISEEARV